MLTLIMMEKQFKWLASGILHVNITKINVTEISTFFLNNFFWANKCFRDIPEAKSFKIQHSNGT